MSLIKNKSVLENYKNKKKDFKNFTKNFTVKIFESPKFIFKNSNGFTMVEVLAAVAIIGVTILGVGSILKSVADARLKNSTVSQMIELESRVIRSFQNYNSFECKLPPATGAGSAKQALINAVESTQALGTVLTPLAAFTIPLINDGTPTSSLTTTDGINGVCLLPGFQLALANDTGGKTYVDKDLNILGSAATPLNTSVFEILATIKCDGPAYNVATDKKKFCAAAYQIKVVNDPANPGRNITNILPVGTMVWNATLPGNFPIRNTAADFNLAAGIGGADYNFHISTDVFRKVNIANVDVVSDANDCSDGNMTDALFVTGYDRDTGKVICAKKPVVDPGCGSDEIPIGLKYDIMTGEVKTNCVQIFRQVRCPDARYVMNSVNLMALDSRQSPPSPPGTCVWAAQTSVVRAPAPISGQSFVEMDLCPKDYQISSGSVSCTVTPTGNFTNGICTESVSSTFIPPYACLGWGNCPLPVIPPAVPGPSVWGFHCPSTCGNYYSCDATTNTYSQPLQTSCNCTVTGNRVRCVAVIPPQNCSGGSYSVPPGCWADFISTMPTWDMVGTFNLGNYTCERKPGLPNTINATY